MLSTFFKSHWIALLISAGTIATQFGLIQTELTPVLLGLTVLTWGLT